MEQYSVRKGVGGFTFIIYERHASLLNEPTIGYYFNGDYILCTTMLRMENLDLLQFVLCVS